MLLAMSAHSDEIDLSDVRLFADGTPHAVFRRLRRESPVYWNEGTEGTGFWALTRHADVLEVSRDSERFSSEQHGIMIYDESFETSGRERTMLERDAPQHTRLRALVSRGMTGRRVLELEAFARDSFAKILDRAQEMGRCDFVEDVASQLPLQIITEMMGIPESDRGPLGVLANRVQGFDDPDLGGGDGPGENSAAISEMSDYALELGRARRRQPRDDIATWILEAKVEGYAMNDAAFAAFFMLLITAGIETTKSAVSGGMLALMEHPGQWANLGRDPQALPAAIEEMIRWTTPIHHFRRTATRDTEIRGQAIGRGDRVVVWYSSANRDESVFEDPDRFDIGREPNEHLAFGFGRHFCLGASLARMEIRVVFESLLARGIEVESLGPFDYMLSSFTNSLKRMPVALRTNG
jgi:cholest-4-en-3-one 26-monooxygenase